MSSSLIIINRGEDTKVNGVGPSEISGIYCSTSSDYPFLGRLLQESYASLSKVEELIKGGDIWTFDFDDGEPLYYWDDLLTADYYQTREFSGMETMMQYALKQNCDFVYCFDREQGRWMFTDKHRIEARWADFEEEYYSIFMKLDRYYPERVTDSE